ncbi:nucleolus and neural progenitor protein isoform X2 [Notolabrus celidotus]|uniref:nucleolus and neural progenitor protein isoform X2 n=1 Tax=Notolabrus celidotus TaxID=1203425 RepID=UPI00148F70E0|nr:nucleolus and neural progenitor protein isoform X2 [Notolabrus celidotus]
MAAELWNRINIPFPGAVSSVRIHFSRTTDANVKSLLAENEKVLLLIRSEILQTEIRVLYELLYILKNSLRGNRTYRGMQQVEQCVNRLKRMNLDGALQDLKELCPNRFQRGLSIKSGECDLPSQPMLEWLCLKVLGASQLMSCTLNRCSRAFSLSRQQMKWEEFVILNVVITSMLSRLWVMFRGVLCCLSTLYQQLLTLLKVVAEAQPMPFLTDFSLPADVALFLDSSAALLLAKQSAHGAKAKDQKKKLSSVVKTQGQKKKVKEDLGVAIERGSVPAADMKPFLKVFNDFTKDKSFQTKTQNADRKKEFKKQLIEATTISDMETCLEEMIQWSKSQKMKKEKCLLTFLRLKCQRIKCLEAAGYNVHRTSKSFRQEACWALSPQGPMPTSFRSSAALRKNAHLRTHFHLLRSRFKSSGLKTGVKAKLMKTKTKRTAMPESGRSGDNKNNRTSNELTSHTTEHGSHNDIDDIDDIFASVGL